MIKSEDMKSTKANLNKTEVPMEDPRIDSPDIKVIYPTPADEMTATKELRTEDLPKVEENFQDRPTVEPMPVESGPDESTTKENCQCKADLQEAVKKNSIAVAIALLVIFGLGYLVGSGKPK